MKQNIFQWLPIKVCVSYWNIYRINRIIKTDVHCHAFASDCWWSVAVMTLLDYCICCTSRSTESDDDDYARASTEWSISFCHPWLCPTDSAPFELCPGKDDLGLQSTSSVTKVRTHPPVLTASQVHYSGERRCRWVRLKCCYKGIRVSNGGLVVVDDER